MRGLVISFAPLLFFLACSGSVEPEQDGASVGSTSGGGGPDSDSGAAGGPWRAEPDAGTVDAPDASPPVCAPVPCPEAAPVAGPYSQDTCPPDWTAVELWACPDGVPQERPPPSGTQHCMVSAMQGWSCEPGAAALEGTIVCCCPDGVCIR